MARGKGWRDPAKEQFWRKAVRGWQRSGLSIRAYCGRNQLSENNFYAWRREIARRDAHPQCGRGRPGAQRSRRRGSVIADKNLFVPVPVASSLACASIEIVLSSPRTVRVGPGFDRRTLSDVVATLEAVPC